MAYRIAFKLKGGPYTNDHEFRLESRPHLLGDTLSQAARDLMDFVATLRNCPRSEVNIEQVVIVSCWMDRKRLDKRVVKEALYQRIVKEREQAESKLAKQPEAKLPVRPPAGPVAPAKRPTIWDHRKKKP
jgi:hypothetical protein